MKPVRKLVWWAVIVIGLMLAVLIGFWVRPLSYFNALTYVQMRLAGAHMRRPWAGGARTLFAPAGHLRHASSPMRQRASASLPHHLRWSFTSIAIAWARGRSASS